MTHLDFVRPSGQWAAEMTPGATDYQRADVNQSKSIDADDGGATYAPSAPINIAGAGISMTSTSLVSGGVETRRGGRIQIPTGDAPVLAPNRTRTINVPILQCGIRVDPIIAGGSQTFVGAYTQRDDNWFQVVFAPSAYGIGIAIVGVPPLGNGFWIDIPKRYTHNGARLTGLGVKFVTAQNPNVQVAPSMTFWEYSNAGASVSFATPRVIDNANKHYQIQLLSPTTSMILTSCFLNFDTITSMAFE